MKSIVHPLVIVVTGLILFTSCTVTKRHFRKGWHVEWKTAERKTETERKAVIESESALEAKTTIIRSAEPEAQLPIDELEQLTTIRMDEVETDVPVQTETETETAVVNARQSRVRKSEREVVSSVAIAKPVVSQLNQDEDPEPNPKKIRRQERWSNFWEGLSSVLLVLLVIVLIGLMLFALYAALKVSIGLFFLVLIPVIIVAIVVGLLISLINDIWDAASEVGGVLLKGPHP